MDRQALNEQMKVLKNKARAARRAGNKEAGKAFRSGARRLERSMRALPKEAPAPAEA